MNKKSLNDKKSNRFQKVATKRIDLILKTLHLLSNCSNRNSYEYEEKDIKKMFSVIKDQLRIAESLYSDQINKMNKKNFKF